MGGPKNINLERFYCNWEAFIGVGFGWGVGFSTLYVRSHPYWH
jgi:hypothetical protein